jgi:hypothetical protein
VELSRPAAASRHCCAQDAASRRISNVIADEEDVSGLSAHRSRLDAATAARMINAACTSTITRMIGHRRSVLRMLLMTFATSTSGPVLRAVHASGAEMPCAYGMDETSVRVVSSPAIAPDIRRSRATRRRPFARSAATASPCRVHGRWDRRRCAWWRRTDRDSRPSRR